MKLIILTVTANYTSRLNKPITVNKEPQLKSITVNKEEVQYYLIV